MAEAPFRNEPLLTPEQLVSRLDEFYKAVREFNEGYYFESHETLEDLWMVTPWPEREFFQGIIQLAAAFVHFVRGEYPGIIKLLDAAAAKIGAAEGETFGVEAGALLAGIIRVRDEIAALGPERFRAFDEWRRPRIEIAAARSQTSQQMLQSNANDTPMLEDYTPAKRRRTP